MGFSSVLDEWYQMSVYLDQNFAASLQIAELSLRGDAGLNPMDYR